METGEVKIYKSFYSAMQDTKDGWRYLELRDEKVDNGFKIEIFKFLREKYLYNKFYNTPIEFKLKKSSVKSVTKQFTAKESLSLYQQAGSGWRFVFVKKMDINIIKFNPIRAKSYILLDKNLATKNAIINIKNEDNQCFKWCVTKALNPKDKSSERVDKKLKNQAEKINWDKIEIPVLLNQITQFEKNNTDISVNVYGYENSEVHILHVSKKNDRKHLIDLLLISNGETNHYCLIKNLSKVPPPKLTMQFTNHNKSMRVLFVVYADFESFIKPIDTCKPNPNESYTKRYQKHILSSFCYYVKCFDKSIYQSSPGMIFTDENKHDFNAAISYHICGEKLENDKVRDHCHITGKYRGAAHENCNLNYKIPKFFPKLSGRKLSCIPNNDDKYISFCREIKVREFIDNEAKKVEVKRELCFLDYRFMSDSLDGLSNNLKKDQCKNIGKLYSGIFSRLKSEGISDDDYSHAQIVWKEFNCKTFRDYHDLYNVLDVLLLADVYENFRDVCMNHYDLDPAWYYTAPGLAWDTAFKKNEI
ncbi:uncharacterized protein LOC136080335 [Hydra vulgaris]|uniref:Uncharacterized protein LOC136080335 n=1 Tax=Hydra vulgaris TaxID=6087 RepID=A0ABM4BV03_HYDVU